MNSAGKGFTLIELLIVIAILAILTTVVLVVINPVQMFAQTRDSERIYDVNTLSNAVALYLTTVTLPSLEGGGCTCGTKDWDSSSNAPASASGFSNGYPFCGLNYGRAIDGSGWMPVKLSDISGGSPISTLPVDPIANNDTYYYSYGCDNAAKHFEFNAKMESCRYSHGENSGCGSVAGSDDVEGTDGGYNNNRYEVGNQPGLNL